MRKSTAAIGTTVFFFVAPGMVAGLGPWWVNGWRFSSPAWDPRPVRWAGVALIVAGLAVLIECFARFVNQGRGTPAPPMPTETLVVSGLYQYVRNPMYVAVFTIVVGQGLLFGDVQTLVYAACVWMGFTIFVMLYEEPTLRRTFGAQYSEYCAHVGRWWPRATAWKRGS
jgi:protein-S-isoprenylcysteine O-methyltransferase Ste14